MLPLERSSSAQSCSRISWDQNGYYAAQEFCFREFIKTESVTAMQLTFRLRFNIQPPTRKSICIRNHQFEQIGCLCKGKCSGQPRVSEENVRRIQESFKHSPRKSTRRASTELRIPQQLSGVCWGAFTVQLSPSFIITLCVCMYVYIYIYIYIYILDFYCTF